MGGVGSFGRFGMRGGECTLLGDKRAHELGAAGFAGQGAGRAAAVVVNFFYPECVGTPLALNVWNAGVRLEAVLA